MYTQLVIVFIYMLVSIGIGIAVSRNAKTAAAFQGVGMGIPAIVCASAGEWLGGTATSGVAEYGFRYGISGMWYTLANAMGVLFLALCFAKLYRSLEKVTVPGIVERYYGVRARVLTSVLLCLVMLAVGVSQMMAAGKLGEALLGIPFSWSVVLFGAVITGYTAFGGMKAVSATNLLHLFVMYFGVITAVVLCLKSMGNAAFREGLEAASARTGTDMTGAFSIGVPKVIAWIIASMLGACTAQAGIQPVLAAKDERSAKTACILTACVVAPFGVFTALLGMEARVMSEAGSLLDSTGALVTEAKLALPALMLNMPPAVGGLVLASILAAIFSTAAPIFLAVGTMISRDVASLRISSERRIGQINRTVIVISGIVCSVGAVLLVDAGAILDIVYGAYSLRGAIFLVILYGIYWKRANERAACASLVITAAVSAVWIGIHGVTGTYPLAPWFSETYAAVLAAGLSMPVCVWFTERSGRSIKE